MNIPQSVNPTSIAMAGTFLGMFITGYARSATIFSSLWECFLCSKVSLAPRAALRGSSARGGPVSTNKPLHDYVINVINSMIETMRCWARREGFQGFPRWRYRCLEAILFILGGKGREEEQWGSGAVGQWGSGAGRRSR